MSKEGLRARIPETQRQREKQAALATKRYSTYERRGLTRMPPVAPCFIGLLLFICGILGITPMPTITLSAASTLPLLSITPVTLPSLVLQTAPNS